MRVLPPKPTLPAPQKPKQHRRLPFTAWLRLIAFILFLLVIGAIVYGFRTIPKRFNILVIGSDQRAEERGRSDVLMVVSVPKSPRDAISVMTIPRDTRVDVEGFGMQKITHAYALGTVKEDGKSLGNRLLTKETVERFLGIQIDGTLEITFESFQDIIDKLGGVTTATYGHLTGEEALAKVRDRSREGGDFARTKDQREILVEVLSEIRKQNALRSTYAYLKSSSTSRVLLPKTRFALFSAYAVIRRGGRLNLQDVHNEVIPGRSQKIFTPEFQKELYYWIPDTEQTRTIVATWFS
ncbi:MAG: LCP family protein [bacterium]